MTSEQQQESFSRDAAIEKAEELLLRNIYNACREYPPSMRIVVDVATSNKKARKHGWPDAASMKDSVGRVLKILPRKMAKRIEIKYV